LDNVGRKLQQKENISKHKEIRCRFWVGDRRDELFELKMKEERKDQE
jgi:hypothetical protein